MSGRDFSRVDVPKQPDQNLGGQPGVPGGHMADGSTGVVEQAYGRRGRKAWIRRGTSPYFFVRIAAEPFHQVGR